MLDWDPFLIVSRSGYLIPRASPISLHLPATSITLVLTSKRSSISATIVVLLATLLDGTLIIVLLSVLLLITLPSSNGFLCTRSFPSKNGGLILQSQFTKSWYSYLEPEKCHMRAFFQHL